MILLFYKNNNYSTVFTHTKYSVIYMNIIFNMMYLRTSKYVVYMLILCCYTVQRFEFIFGGGVTDTAYLNDYNYPVPK